MISPGLYACCEDAVIGHSFPYVFEPKSRTLVMSTDPPLTMILGRSDCQSVTLSCWLLDLSLRPLTVASEKNQHHTIRIDAQFPRVVHQAAHVM